MFITIIDEEENPIVNGEFTESDNYLIKGRTNGFAEESAFIIQIKKPIFIGRKIFILNNSYPNFPKQNFYQIIDLAIRKQEIIIKVKDIPEDHKEIPVCKNCYWFRGESLECGRKPILNLVSGEYHFKLCEFERYGSGDCGENGDYYIENINNIQ